MGNTSATLLIQKKGRLNATARGISAALGAVGCAGEEATLYRRESDRFYILCGAEPYPGPGGDALYALADACAQNLGTCALSVEEYDSDVAILRLTDGQTASAIAFGLVESELLEELEREPYQEALWKPLFPTKRGWAAFEQLRSQQARLPETLEGDDFDAFFAEEAIHTIAETLKFDAEAARGFAEESDAEAVWRWPEQAKAGKRDLWMPEDAPPAFIHDCEVNKDGEVIDLTFFPCGGKGRGFDVVILPLEGKMSVEDYDFTEAFLQYSDGQGGWQALALANVNHWSMMDGKRGWLTRFPDIEFPAGLQKLAKERGGIQSCVSFETPDIAPRFRLRIPVQPRAKTLQYYSLSSYTINDRDRSWKDFCALPAVYIWVEPVENRSGSTSVRRALYIDKRIEGKMLQEYREARQQAEVALQKNRESETQA